MNVQYDLSLLKCRLVGLALACFGCGSQRTGGGLLRLGFSYQRVRHLRAVQLEAMTPNLVPRSETLTGT